MRYHRKIILGIKFGEATAFHTELNFMIDGFMSEYIYVCSLFCFKVLNCLGYDC